MRSSPCQTRRTKPARAALQRDEGRLPQDAPQQGALVEPIQRPVTAAVWTVIHRPLTAAVWTVYKCETWENKKQSLVFAFGGVGRGKKTQCSLLVFWLAFRGVRPADQLLVVRMLERGRGTG